MKAMKPLPPLKVWKTIKLGTGIKSGKHFCSSLEQKKFRSGKWARDMLQQKAFTIAAEETAMDLVVLSVAELGFKAGAHYQQICTRALELGLELCPAEVGPQLRLQYPDQPHNETLTIAMEVIRGSDGEPYIFRVWHGKGGRWLSSYFGDPGIFWSGRSRFVFRSRKHSLAA
jgi:hypothetical protein